MTRPPAVDTMTDRASVIVHERSLVPLTSWLMDALTASAASGRAVQILTVPTTRITAPLRLVLGASDGRWVVQEPGEAGYYDGLSGLPLTWDGSAFVPVNRSAPQGPSPSFLREGAGSVGHLRVELRVTQPAAADLDLGGALEALAATVTGTAPTNWGSSEPALFAWRRGDVTGLCRRRAPRPTFLVFVGQDRTGCPAVIGTQRVERVPSGVKESITFVAGYDAGRPAPVDELADLADTFARTGTWSP
ncbi:DUF6177 family protein [Actinomadura sp. 9N215]|uniref:DUF6177 family protein n=1 Tax=Actinomadura sp. 9N215 TaxID=3375150 RepID=UPI0037A366A0